MSPSVGAALTALIARGAFGLTTGARMLDGMSAAVGAVVAP